MNTKKIAVIIGSLRKESFNKKIAQQLINMAPKELEMEIIEIGDMPHYNEDLDKDNVPASWEAFRNQMLKMDGVLFVTPEYNRGLPSVIKNALDVGSRPFGKSIWDNKPAAIISGSVSGIGGFGANHQLRQSAVFLNMPMMQQPEAYIPTIQNIFDEEGNIKSDATKEVFQKFINAYAEWVRKIN